MILSFHFSLIHDPYSYIVLHLIVFQYCSYVWHEKKPFKRIYKWLLQINTQNVLDTQKIQSHQMIVKLTRRVKK